MSVGRAEREHRAGRWAELELPDLTTLTSSLEKCALYATDPLLAEGWASLRQALGDAGAYDFVRQTALVWLRPDLLASGTVDVVLARIEAEGFRPLAAVPAELDRAGVRALWWWPLKWATAERLVLLDAVASLGPGLLLLYGHPSGEAAQRMTALKGSNDPEGRATDTLRSLAGSPGRVLTMVHTSDDGADVARELAALLTWEQRRSLVVKAQQNRPGPGAASDLAHALATVRARFGPGSSPPAGWEPAPQDAEDDRGDRFERMRREVSVPDLAGRWAAVQLWAPRIPAVNDWRLAYEQGAGELEPLLQRGGRAAVVDGGADRGEGVGERGAEVAVPVEAAARGQSAGGVGEDGVARRTPFTSEDAVDSGGVVVGVAAAKAVGCGTVQPEIGRVQGAFAHTVLGGDPHAGGGGGGDLIEPVVAADHQGAGPAVGENLSQHRGEGAVGTADEGGPGAGGVGQRGQVVDGGGDAEGLADRDGVAQSVVEARGEGEADPDVVHAPGHGVGGEVQGQAQGFEDVGAAGLGGDRPAAVLDHGVAGGGHDDRGHRADVDRVGAVAPGADDVEHLGSVDRERDDAFHQRVEQPAQFGGGLALGAQGDEEAGQLGGLGGVVHDLPHGPCGVVGAQVGSGQERGEQSGPRPGLGHEGDPLDTATGARGTRRPMSASVSGPIGSAPRFRPPGGGLVRVNVNRAWARGVAAAHLGLETSPVKGDRGFVIVVGGSALYGSSPYMAGLGALRAGAHCVYAVAPGGAAAASAGLQMHLVPPSGPELDVAAVGDLVRVSSRLEEQVARTGARGQVVWLIGPGLGGSPAAMEVLDALAEARDGSAAAVVVDGSLGGGEQGVERIRGLGADTVLLNRAEAAALTGADARLTDRTNGATWQDLLDLAGRTGAVVAAKGPTDLVVTPWSVHRVAAGHPDLAKASTGDVVAGVTAGLLAQRLPAPRAAALACYLVGTAGHRVSGARGPGWLPTELLDALPHAWRTTRAPALARLARLLLNHRPSI